MKRAHFIGICGAGMSAVATILKEQGYEISGSDTGFLPPISDYLTALGIKVAREYAEENIPDGVEFVVAGGSAKVTPEDNPEVRAAVERGIPVKSFPEVLGEFAADKETIIVSGSYGKSTMTAIIAWCLINAGKDPSYFIGALPVDGTPPAHAGSGKYFVIEGDEYPTSGVDKRSKFLHFRADNVIFISGEHDHVNVFTTEEEYHTPYIELLSGVTEGGTIAACIDNQHVDALIAPHVAKTQTYGLNTSKHPRWSAMNITHGDMSTFTLTRDDVAIRNIQTTLLGAHNIQNIIGAAALLLSIGALTPEEFAEGVATFKGLARRLDKKTEKSSVLVYEGFGSSYDKARAAISAMRTHFPGRRLLIVFEPHTFSWRNRARLHQYETVFDDADHVFIYPPPMINMASHDQVTQDEILAHTNTSGVPVTKITDGEQGLAAIAEILHQNDIVLMLTSGNLGGLVQTLPKFAEERFPL
jgi:UDP-N-acetylmuramate: L-alanyl-gamma-D-glutamyl-meso-diaminopimelate ligase